ncbi:hypothetical protein N865_03510 [Intrasporangium oryzae NRRL B-24470]|uniref:DUF5709 domain-containing protein n=1 Tax=Intrasporangium oryzae NRRL B-24470 TaxID=1386089 RepID=W9GGN3_9MICO|nr:DUF5709 domain-containing protein [Intrasporangium oryzae]EWT02994.1 hypothetical protein N865_03510 [Intrasporangium oryzae NRRL B-24470]
MTSDVPNENLDDDLTSYSVDDEDQLQPEDTLDADDVDDALDRGYSPSERAQGSTAFGTTAYEQSLDETIDQRIQQEVPDPNSAYGAPLNESGLDEERVGGDDPDSIDAEDDWLGDSEVGDARAGRLVADDEGAHEDEESQVWARDVGVDGAAASAEEAAMHIIANTGGPASDEGDDEG